MPSDEEIFPRAILGTHVIGSSCLSMRTGSCFPGSGSNHLLNGVEQERQSKNNVIMWYISVTTLA
jgi:hypothetical protein